MDFSYRTLIYIHVLSAIGSIGPFFVLFSLIKKLPDAQGELLQSYIKTFKHVVRFTKHAGHVLVFSGVLLVILGPWTWKTSWIVLTLMAMFLSIFFLARAFSPTLNKFQDDKQDKATLASKLNRTLWNYVLLLLLMLWFMVTKPTLW